MKYLVLRCLCKLDESEGGSWEETGPVLYDLEGKEGRRKALLR